MDSLGIRRPSEIDIELIAAYLNLHVKRSALRHEEGRLLRAGSAGVIVVADHAYASSKWRFVVAHEIGHFLRHPDADTFGLCTSADLTTYLGSGREAEANDFAGELLMPEHMFAPRCDRNRPSLKDVGEVAAVFHTSLTATALRFVQFAPEPCAVVFSTAGVVTWQSWTQNFLPTIRNGMKLGKDTYAGDLHRGESVADRPHLVDASAWSANPRVADLDLFEHSRKVGTDSVLTFLWHPDP
ncbi:MAG: ImmA/IrrE family metallo-endopeptidase [Polyangiaceae bacterium]